MTSIRVRLATAVASGAVVLVAALGVVSAQQPAPTIKKGEFQAITSVDGRANFVAYCAACHGLTAKGDGPAVPALKTMVPDLTTMAKRTGKFDPIGVERFIAGMDKIPPAHGGPDMPIWGPVFKSQGGDAQATLRLKNLATYLKSIQAGS